MIVHASVCVCVRVCVLVCVCVARLTRGWVVYKSFEERVRWQSRKNIPVKTSNRRGREVNRGLSPAVNWRIGGRKRAALAEAPGFIVSASPHRSSDPARGWLSGGRVRGFARFLGRTVPRSLEPVDPFRAHRVPAKA